MRPSERRFLHAMQDLGHGHFKSVRVFRGELLLEPWPTTIRSIKFGNVTPNQPASALQQFELKDKITDFFNYVRSLDGGVIRVLEVRGGLPFSMEVAEEQTRRKPWQ